MSRQLQSFALHAFRYGIVHGRAQHSSAFARHVVSSSTRYSTSSPTSLLGWAWRFTRAAYSQPAWSGLLPTHHLRVARDAWSMALASPRIMNPVVMGGGMPNLAAYAHVWRQGSSGVTGPRIPSLAQIDARLRRCMHSALHSYTISSSSARIVLINALQISGKNIPYLMGALVADMLQRGRGFCDAPLVSPEAHGDVVRVHFEQGVLEWVRAVWGDIAHNAAMILHVFRLWLLFAPLVLTAPLVFHFGVSRPTWMAMLRETMEAAGPAYIKWGQWAATRKDMFPPDMCQELALLQCSAPEHKWHHTKATIETSFGMPLEMLVDWIDHEPIASGSIGQVHKAELSSRGGSICGMPAGTLVAIKVKHPGVSRSIQRDFSIMMWVANQLEWIPALRKMRLGESLSQFAAPLREQELAGSCLAPCAELGAPCELNCIIPRVDLSLEGNTLWRFNRNFAHDPDVTLPVPLYPWVSQDVLMQTFEEGMHISTYMDLDQDSARRAAVADVGSHCMLNMMLVHNLIHSDLHPGNILVRWQLPDGWLINSAAQGLKWLNLRSPDKMFEAWLRPQVVLLDVGMATELSSNDRDNMLHLFRAFSEMDGERMAESALSFAGGEQRCLDREGFKQAISESMDAFKVDSWAETQFSSPAAAFASILDIVREYEVTLPGHICAVLVTVLVLEGWSSALKPEHSVLAEVKNLVAVDTSSWMERLSVCVEQWMEWAPVLPSLDTV